MVKKHKYLDTVPDEPIEKIIEGYERLIYIHSMRHVRDGVELEDLIEEGRRGVVEAYQLYTNPRPEQKLPNYSFHQSCLYKLRSNIFYYCLNNASPLKTPIYVQRGCMHVGQIFKILSNQHAAEELFGREGPATEQEIKEFLYDETNRLPTAEDIKKGKARYTIDEIKSMIVRKEDDKYFDQILDGVLHHRNGSRHSFVKNSLTDKGKVLHIKNKLYFCAEQNQMKYKRVIDLILSARVLVSDLDSGFQKPSSFNIELEIARRQIIQRGRELVGEYRFNIFVDSVLHDLTYGKIAEKYGIKKSKVSDIINQCLNILRSDETFQQLYKEYIV